jgi:hypothetical protein
MNDTCTYDMYKKDTWYDMYDMYVDKWYMNDMFVDEWYMYDMYMNNIGFACLAMSQHPHTLFVSHLTPH